ncbi:MAG TPA: hypothetical protein VJQ55_05570 [Candidatus Binatia bacterium]|nr:hypothetical protein [Candidatus Binatia bacterium]
MWYRSYRDHVIMAFPSFDTATSLWAPQANITWVDGACRKSEFVRFAKRVMTEGDAVALALNASHAWIDRRLRTMDKGEIQSVTDEPSPVASPSLLRSHSTKLSRTLKTPRSSAGILTYAQFKSLIEKTGLGGSERSLQKSYTALAKLRRENHCSWALIRSKMEHRQEKSPAGGKSPGKAKPARLPVTLRDWRRVI